jgi:hypothetical protein
VNRDRKHPGATGIAPWIEWKFSERQRFNLGKWVRSWELERVDEAPLLDTIETSIRTYVQMKALARESSPKSVRRNLENAVKASKRLVARVNQLDGNSHQIIRNLMRGGSIRDSVVETHETLLKAHEFAVAGFPTGGRGPEHERDMLAALLADALETHSSAKPTATRGKIFEELLCEIFSLLGETARDRHTLAERVLARKLVSRPGEGVVEISTYELAPKRRH